jgi:hypothetical protein
MYRWPAGWMRNWAARMVPWRPEQTAVVPLEEAGSPHLSSLLRGPLFSPVQEAEPLERNGVSAHITSK